MIDLFCIASGPSLTAEDCDLVRQSGAKVIAVNNSWRMAPFCDFLYAGDAKWWRTYHKEINIPAERWTCSRVANINYGLKFHRAGGGFNSGMRAIQFGLLKGFKKIALLGYDCSLKNGIHWHGPHVAPLLRNPSSQRVQKWHEQFARLTLKIDAAGAKVFNCSRYTELECFQRMKLEDVLQENFVAVH